MAEEKKDNVDAATPSGGMPDWVRFPLVLAIVGGFSALALSGLYALTQEKIEESKSAKVWSALASVLRAPTATFVPQKNASGQVERYHMKDEKGTVLGVVRPVMDAKAKDSKPVLYYELADEAGKVNAYAAQVKCPGSYNSSDPIELIVVLSKNLSRVVGVRIVKSAETPGLGQRVKAPAAARSLVGIIAGRPAKERVVQKKGGALVGAVEKKSDGSVVVTVSGADPRTFSKEEVAEVTQAPFPPAFLDLLTGVDFEKAKLKSQGGVVDALTGATISSRAVMNGVAEAEKHLRAAVAKSN
jgi:Na+-translocating ferredoxin:NAD+ oxidoreductase RnfG subunit